MFEFKKRNDLEIYDGRKAPLSLHGLYKPEMQGFFRQSKLAIVEQSYQERLKQGDKNIYFISGQDIYYSHDSEMMTIDGVRPNDMGAFCIAEAIYKVLSTCLHLNES